MSVLVDTPVWVDHFRDGNKVLITLLESGRVMCHPFIVGEVSSLWLDRSAEIVSRLEDLPQVQVATDSEARYLMEFHGLRGDDLSWVDLHLLASVLLSTCCLWTLDPVLHSAAHMLNVSL